MTRASKSATIRQGEREAVVVAGRELPYFPAAMPLHMAAAYCGVTPDTFKQHCPVKPIRLGVSSRGDRFLRQRLDEWLLSLDRNGAALAPVKRLEDYFGGQSASARA